MPNLLNTCLINNSTQEIQFYKKVNFDPKNMKYMYFLCSVNSKISYDKFDLHFCEIFLEQLSKMLEFLLNAVLSNDGITVPK